LIVHIILLFCIFISHLLGEERNAIDYYDKIKNIRIGANLTTVTDSILSGDILANDPSILAILEKNSEINTLIDSALACPVAELHKYEDSNGFKLPHISPSLNYLAVSSLSEVELGHNKNVLPLIVKMYDICSQVDVAINKHLFFPAYSLALRSYIFQTIEFLLNDPAIPTDLLKEIYNISLVYRKQFGGWEVSLNNYEQKQLSESGYSPPTELSYKDSIYDSYKLKLLELGYTIDQIDSTLSNLDSQFTEKLFGSKIQ